MEKNMLNEIAKMRKMMGLNENYDTYFDTSSEDNWEKGGGPDEEEIFDAHFEKRTYNGKERTFLVDEFGEEHSLFKIVNTPEAEKELEMYNLNDKMNTGSSVTGVFNVDVDGVQTKVLTYPAYSEKPEMYENLNEIAKMRKMMGLNESTNGEMGHNINFVGEDKGYSSESVGIVSDRGKLMAGYFQDGRLVSLGDRILFDVHGNLVKMGGGYPTGGFKNETSAEELEQDICKSYDDVLETFRKDAPVAVSLNEATYEIIKRSVECNI